MSIEPWIICLVGARERDEVFRRGYEVATTLDGYLDTLGVKLRLHTVQGNNLDESKEPSTQSVDEKLQPRCV